MSTKTSHRRKSRQHRSVEQFFAESGLNVVRTEQRICRGRCRSQCDECHDIDNCVEGTRRYGDMVLCEGCRSHHPVIPPWQVDPVSGEFVDASGRVL